MAEPRPGELPPAPPSSPRQDSRLDPTEVAARLAGLRAVLDAAKARAVLSTKEAGT